MRPSPPLACSRRAGRWTSTACTARIRPASFPGSARGSPSCGGAPIRAWCCYTASSRCTGRCARPWLDASPIHASSCAWTARSRRSSGPAPAACDRAVRHVDRASDGRRVRSIPSRRIRAQCRSLDRWPLGRRSVLCGDRAGRVRRIDVHTRCRCVQDRVGRPHRLLPAPRHRADRLPAEHPAPGLARRARNRPGRFCGASSTERKKTIAGLAVRPRILGRTPAAKPSA